MWLFDGLPLHPLVVHAPVVLIPLVATGLVAWVVWPSTRKWLGPVLAALAVGAAATAVLATLTGEQLAEVLQRGDAVEVHEERGELTRLVAIVMALGVVGLAAVDRWATESWAATSRLPGIVVTVVALAATVGVGLTGHSGATLAWEDKIDAALGADGDDATAAPAPTTPVPSVAATPPPTSPGPDPAPTPGSVAVEELVDVVLGEWTIVMSVDEAPPGPTRFRIRNAGTHTHAFRIRTPGSGGDRQEWRSDPIAPGEQVEVEWDLPTGDLEVDCPVEDEAGEHDALGMEAVLTVREGAPPVTSAAPPPSGSDDRATAAPDPGTTPGPAEPAPDRSAGAVTIDISAFAFVPPEVTVPVGTEVTWANQDPTAHTATGDDFDTGTVAGGASASTTFDTPGEFAYVCTIHPSMEGLVVVTG
ncbi:DUF2231 domain-containing protein [Salsipaludibacter albus]|uniref:DUF2231 domain-containing protein n=1 Tax=Salsipaludibacter albus TaxID=2849650 RepID=UPI001EE3CABF|nr:DUF2231 domain-containing protein [Salsipaludibacter albus]MBY5162042.1 cupredoxin domain-containing protein [Salsipaludibacter albus]